MIVHFIFYLISPVLAFHSSDQIYLVRRPTSTYLRGTPRRHTLPAGYSPLIFNAPVDSEHHSLQFSPSVRHIIREPHREINPSSHRIPSSVSRLLMQSQLEDISTKEPAYYVIANPQTLHKEIPFLSGRNFPSIPQGFKPQASKFLPSALKRDFLSEEEMPLAMAEDVPLPIYSMHKKPAFHHMRPHVYDEFDQSSEQSSSFYITPRPYVKDQSMMMRGVKPRYSPRMMSYLDLNPMMAQDYQRPKSLWGHRRDGDEDIDEMPYDMPRGGQLEMEENEKQSHKHGEKKKRKKKKKKPQQQTPQQTQKTDKEWMSMPEVMTSEEMISRKTHREHEDYTRHNSNSEEVDWSHVHPEEILRVDNHRNATNFH